jgi:hypothetical protein
MLRLLCRIGGRIGCCLAVAALVASRPALATVCALDPVPAATLLLPYFEVDLSHPDGVSTLLSVNNAGSPPVLVNLVLWTDLGVPTLSVPIYLTGFDVQTINLRDLFRGMPPGTASAGQDPLDSVSPKGAFSQDLNFASCDGLLPPQPLDAATLAHIVAAHTGQRSAALGGCAGRQFGDGLARGYVTLDTVSSCSLDVRYPTDPGYFAAGGHGRATDQNVLWGDYFLVDPAKNFSTGESLVRLEAVPGRFVAGDTTFYGRMVGYTGADDREPLSTQWATRYVNGGAFKGGTDLILWRDPERPGIVYDCPVGPTGSWFPLGQSSTAVFDEEEHLAVPLIFPTNPPPACFSCLLLPAPAVTNRVTVGGASLPVPFVFGWLFFDLQNPILQPTDPHAQSYVATIVKTPGRYAVQTTATALDSSCAPKPCVPGSTGACLDGN